MISKSRYINWIIGLATVGVLLSIYSLLHKTGFTSGAICNLSDTFSCDIVNQGPYSEMFGIPVAGIGIVGYFFIFVAALLKRKNPTDRSLSTFLLIASIGGFLFALYLTGLEAFVLHVWCIVCLASQATITALLVFSFLYYRSERI
ncbi:MAG TPA: vitamin K epoxide reductase family protein [Patescibacteria group bacterium]|nr:vitamin K epoxide reductase family protein [Patescibacteria group bacterium]